MSIKLKIDVYDGDKKYIQYWCQGCKRHHAITVPSWTWDGSMDTPTFGPSVLSTSGHHCAGEPQPPNCYICNTIAAEPDEDHGQWKCMRCHTFVRGGMVEFLPDCTHDLAGQTLPLPDLPDWMLK